MDGHESVVHPIPDEGLSGAGFGLGDLVFMMGEDEVQPAAVDVECLGLQVLQAHDRAFDVPPRPPRAPRRGPGRFAGLRRFPEGEIQRILLPLVDFHPRTGLKFVQGALGKSSVSGKFSDGIVNVSA